MAVTQRHWYNVLHYSSYQGNDWYIFDNVVLIMMAENIIFLFFFSVNIEQRGTFWLDRITMKYNLDDDVIKWKHFPRYWPFVRGIHRSPVNSPHKGQWRGALMFSLISAWTNGWVNNRKACDSRRHRAYYGINVMQSWWLPSAPTASVVKACKKCRIIILCVSFWICPCNYIKFPILSTAKLYLLQAVHNFSEWPTVA